MRVEPRVLAGIVFFVATAQFFVGMLIAEALYPGYSISGNYISDLGATCTDTMGCVIHQPTANIFNGSIILLGLLAIFGAYLLWRASMGLILSILVALLGVGTIGVGTLTEVYGVAHSIVSLIAFLFGGLGAIWAYTVVKSPFRYVSVILGVAVLAALVLYVSNTMLGLGVGGMERMVVYPEILWGLGFGAHLTAYSPQAATAA